MVVSVFLLTGCRKHTCENFGERVLIEETCIENGIVELYCLECGECKETKSIAKTQHSVSDWVLVKESTCSENGKKQLICTKCGTIVNESLIEKLEHNESAEKVEKELTCTSDGLYYTECLTCGIKLSENLVTTKGHILTEWNIVKDATCLEEGEKIKECTICEEICEVQIIPAKGHTTSEWNIVIPKTCTTNGLKQKYCVKCEIVMEEEIIGSSHNSVVDQRIEPTCISEGLSEGQHCYDCEEVFVKQNIISKIPHEIITKKSLEPTCTKNGLTEGKYCKNCSYVEIPQESIDSVGHSFMIQTNLCTRCNEKEYMEFKSYDDWQKGVGEKAYVVWLSYMGFEESKYYYQTLPKTVEYVRFIGNPSQEYMLHIIIGSRNKEITIEFVNVNLTSYRNHTIYCDSVIDINLNFYGEKCSLIPTKAQNGVNGGLSNDPGYGTKGYSAIYMPHAKLNIITSASQLAIIGGEGGNGGNGGLLGASDIKAKPGADGGVGIFAGEINVSFDGQISMKNIEVNGGSGGNGGKNGGYGATSYAQNGNSGSASNVEINYIID